METTEINVLDYINYNSFITLTMFFISLIIVGLNYITHDKANKYLFSTKRGSLLNPLTYIRLFTHILGHRDFKHFSNNYLKILILGPLIEEKYGSELYLLMILITAFVTGVVNSIKSDVSLRGASNISFMLTVLSAFVNLTSNQIPLTLILIIIFYVIDEIRDLNKDDNIAHYGHLTGAICGGVFGFISMKPDLVENIVSKVNLITKMIFQN